MIRPASFEKASETAARCGYDVHRLEVLLKEGTVEIRRISKVDECGGVLPLKFLLVAPPVENVLAAREKLVWQDKSLWVMSREGLIKMKRLAGRPKDLADIERLENE